MNYSDCDPVIFADEERQLEDKLGKDRRKRLGIKKDDPTDYKGEYIPEFRKKRK